MTHELHFILSESIFKKIIVVSRLLKIKSLSKTVIVMIRCLIPVLEKYQTEFQNRESRYKKITGDDEIRHHIHVYMNDELYRHIKQIHDCLNFYSMAQVLREIIGLYLKDFLNKGAAKTSDKFDRLLKIWGMRKKLLRNKEILRQLSDDNQSFPYITIKFDKNFIPYSLKFH